MHYLYPVLQWHVINKINIKCQVRNIRYIWLTLISVNSDGVGRHARVGRRLVACTLLVLIFSTDTAVYISVWNLLGRASPSLPGMHMQRCFTNHFQSHSEWLLGVTLLGVMTSQFRSANHFCRVILQCQITSLYRRTSSTIIDVYSEVISKQLYSE